MCYDQHNVIKNRHVYTHMSSEPVCQSSIVSSLYNHVKKPNTKKWHKWLSAHGFAMCVLTFKGNRLLYIFKVFELFDPVRPKALMWGQRSLWPIRKSHYYCFILLISDRLQLHRKGNINQNILSWEKRKKPTGIAYCIVLAELCPLGSHMWLVSTNFIIHSL